MRLDSRSEELEVESAPSLYLSRAHPLVVFSLCRIPFEAVGSKGQRLTWCSTTQRASIKQSWETARIKITTAGAYSPDEQECSPRAIPQSEEGGTAVEKENISGNEAFL